LCLGNAVSEPSVRTDAFIGFGFSDGNLYFFDLLLNLHSSDYTNPETYTPVVHDGQLPTNLSWPNGESMNVDSDDNGKPDSFHFYSITLPPLIPVGDYFVFVSLAEADSYKNGSLKPIGEISLGYIKVGP
jgi:hypothetical protein